MKNYTLYQSLMLAFQERKHWKRKESNLMSLRTIPLYSFHEMTFWNDFEVPHPQRIDEIDEDLLLHETLLLFFSTTTTLSLALVAYWKEHLNQLIQSAQKKDPEWEVILLSGNDPVSPRHSLEWKVLESFRDREKTFENVSLFHRRGIEKRLHNESFSKVLMPNRNYFFTETSSNENKNEMKEWIDIESLRRGISYSSHSSSNWKIPRVDMLL